MTLDAHRVADGVFAFTGTDVNWVIVCAGSDVTLIDAGWHGDAAAVERSIRSVGRRPEDVRAVLLTHAHADHTGAVNALFLGYGVPCFMSAAEIPNATGECIESGRPVDVLRRLGRPRVARWALQITGAGGLRHFPVSAALPFPTEGALDLPGRPTPIATPGHTSGHVSYLLPDAGVVVTGDALVTAHPTLPTVGPQLLPGWFATDPDQVVRSLGALRELEADVIAPGHGPTWRGPIRDAVDRVLGSNPL